MYLHNLQCTACCCRQLQRACLGRWTLKNVRNMTRFKSRKEHTHAHAHVTHPQAPVYPSARPPRRIGPCQRAPTRGCGVSHTSHVTHHESNVLKAAAIATHLASQSRLIPSTISSACFKCLVMAADHTSAYAQLINGKQRIGIINRIIINISTITHLTQQFNSVNQKADLGRGAQAALACLPHARPSSCLCAADCRSTFTCVVKKCARKWNCARRSTLAAAARFVDDAVDVAAVNTLRVSHVMERAQVQ